MVLLKRHAGWGLALVIALGVTACSRDTDPPDFENPFDPQSPTAGEGYDLRAAVVGDAVQLTWFNVREQVGFPTADSNLVDIYTIRHATGGAEPTDRATGVVYPVAPSFGTDILATHRDYVPEVVNSYEVQADPALVAGGTGLDTYVPSRVVSVDAPLAVTTPTGTPDAPSLDVPFVVRSGISDRVEFALDAAFDTGDTIFPLEPGVSTELTFRIVPFETAADTLRVFYRGRTADSVGPVGSITLSPDFTPGIAAEQGIRLDASRRSVAVDSTVVYRANGPGVTSVSVGVTVDEERVELFALDDPTDPIVLPLDDERARNAEDTGWVFVLRVGSELGFTTDVTLTLIEAGPVTSPSLTVVDEEGDGLTQTREVPLEIAATNAGEMILSESADFAGATWRAFAVADTFVLSGGFGEKTIFAGFRNAFDPGFVVTTATTLLVPDDPPGAGTSDDR